MACSDLAAAIALDEELNLRRSTTRPRTNSATGGPPVKRPAQATASGTKAIPTTKTRAGQQGHTPQYESCMCPHTWCLELRKARGYAVPTYAMPTGSSASAVDRQNLWLQTPALRPIPNDCECADGSGCRCYTVRVLCSV
jgi:hypothetical protein